MPSFRHIFSRSPRYVDIIASRSNGEPNTPIIVIAQPDRLLTIGTRLCIQIPHTTGALVFTARIGKIHHVDAMSTTFFLLDAPYRNRFIKINCLWLKFGFWDSFTYIKHIERFQNQSPDHPYPPTPLSDSRSDSAVPSSSNNLRTLHHMVSLPFLGPPLVVGMVDLARERREEEQE